MARYVIDLGAALKIAGGEITPSPAHELLAPTLLRSEALDALYGRVRAGDLAEADGLALNAAFGKLKIRYLGDAVLRRRAWALAARAGMPSTALAEYLALTQLQADALITEDPALKGWAAGLVALAAHRALSV